jgi:TRAP-type C4-dicarboxylate transport system permease small subunit
VETLVDFVDKILRLIDLVCAVILTAITTIVFYEILSRYFLNKPWPLSNELIMLLFPWMIFLGSIPITSKQDHLKVTFLKEMLPARVKRAVNTMIRILTVGFAILMLKSGTDLTILAFSERLPVLSISKLWLYLSMPLSFLGIVLVIIPEFIRRSKRTKPGS